MPDDPTDPHDAEDASDGAGGRRAEMDPAEAEAAFLEGREPGDYPAVLRLTADPRDDHRRDARERLARWKAGEDVPHVVNFQDPSDLRALLTDRRVELLRSVMADPPASIRALADRLERDVKSVHDDLGVLAEYEVVRFEQDGRAKRPVVPYDTIEVSLEISASESVTA
jgi:predicted transcriptional regulator